VAVTKLQKEVNMAKVKSSRKGTIKFYDASDEKFIWLKKHKVIYHLKRFIDVDYTNVEDYMTCHKISKKYKKLLMKAVKEK